MIQSEIGVLREVGVLPEVGVRTPALARTPRTRFAPAPTGWLHLGHVADALVVWAMASIADGTVLLRIEDHDLSRRRAAYDAAIPEDLAWLGLRPDAGPVRQTDADAVAAYEAAAARLGGSGLLYGCDCTRSTFARRAAATGQRWTGPGCPGGCRERDVRGPTLRVALGDGTEAWHDLRLGPRDGPVAPAGDPVVRDRLGQWTYGFAVVVDDLRQGIDLVVRGEDLLEATPMQVRLGRHLGRDRPAAFLHHPLLRRPDGRKLSKSDGDTGVRDLRAAGWTAEEVRATALSGMREVGSERREIGGEDTDSAGPPMGTVEGSSRL